jgi:hypothetical protein
MVTTGLEQKWCVFLGDRTRTLTFPSSEQASTVDDSCFRALGHLAIDSGGGWERTSGPNPQEPESAPSDRSGSSSVQEPHAGLLVNDISFTEQDDGSYLCNECAEAMPYDKIRNHIRDAAPNTRVLTYRRFNLTPETTELDEAVIHDPENCSICKWHKENGVQQPGFGDTYAYKAVFTPSVDRPAEDRIDSEKYPNIAILVESMLEETAQADEKARRAQEVLETTRALADQRAQEIEKLQARIKDLEPTLKVPDSLSTVITFADLALYQKLEADNELLRKMLQTAAEHGVSVNEHLGAKIDWTKVSEQYQEICYKYQKEFYEHRALKDSLTDRHSEAFNSGRAYERKLAREKKIRLSKKPKKAKR